MGVASYGWLDAVGLFVTLLVIVRQTVDYPSQKTFRTTKKIILDDNQTTSYHM